MGESATEYDSVYNESRQVRRMSTHKSRRTSFTTLRDDQSLINEQVAIEDLGDEDESALMVFKNIKPDCWGNLPVSLFWEEKLVLFLKFY